ncbi:hypothetical protein AVEN_185741-1 [Araneus ventricosus]|uniref:Uncharacterized protein n=1 Tax=Araneus ventricosus TaxID=182803 RepID=A0A4Y2I2N8_ARAVE|nr:hypothetical protein AVEN_185741-1 [Araneus ventricosus]
MEGSLSWNKTPHKQGLRTWPFHTFIDGPFQVRGGKCHAPLPGHFRLQPPVSSGQRLSRDLGLSLGIHRAHERISNLLTGSSSENQDAHLPYTSRVKGHLGYKKEDAA